MMLPQPVVRPIPSRALVRLVEDYEAFSCGHCVVVPAGFRFDGASVPPIGWQVTYPPWHPVVLAPALVHDWCYISHCLPRSTADNLFHSMLVRNGAAPGKAWIMWRAVVRAGAAHWEWSEEDLYELRLLWRILRRRGPGRLDRYGFPMEAAGC